MFSAQFDKCFFLSAYDDDCKMDSQAKDDGPMRAAMKASGLVFKPSVSLCKDGYL